jgi:hypothetical protein
VNAIYGKNDGKKALGRHRRGWEDNIKVDIKGISQ